MSCKSISNGRKESCKEQVGGLKNIYFINQDEACCSDVFTLDADGKITAFAAMDLQLYKHELKSFNSSFEQSNEVSRENGTSFFTQTATIVLKSQDEVTHKNMLALSKTSPAAIIQDQNDNYFYLGFSNLLDVSVSTSTGTGLGDLNGYTITITGLEPELAKFVDSTIIGDNTGESTIITA